MSALAYALLQLWVATTAVGGVLLVLVVVVQTGVRRLRRRRSRPRQPVR